MRRAGAPTASSTSRCADEAEAVARRPSSTSSYFQGPLRRLGVRRPAAAARASSPRTACASTTCARVDRHAGRHRLGARAAPRLRRSAWSPRWSASRAGRSASIANNPTHLGGAIDSDGADKAARFMQLCDAFDIPILFLCDTPGIMVGPEVEKTALVRHCSRHVRRRRQPDGAVLHGRAAQGLRPRRAGHGRRQLQGAVLHRGLADRRVRRHGPRGRGASSATATSWRPSTTRRARRRSSTRWSRGMYEHGKALNTAAALRDRRRRSTRPTPGAGS